jgi:hypothetical protein
MARPSMLGAELREEICRLIRAGNFPAIAARSAGIAESTFYRWMERGRSEAKGPYLKFYEAIKEAEAGGEVHLVAVLRKHATDDWRAALALLERRHSDRWRRRAAFEHTLEDERASFDLAELSEADLKELERINARLAKPK